LLTRRVGRLQPVATGRWGGGWHALRNSEGRAEAATTSPQRTLSKTSPSISTFALSPPRLGISLAVPHALRSASGRATRRTVVRMAEALGVSPDALWPGFGGVSVRLLITLLPNCSWSSGSALGHQGWSPGSRGWSKFDQFVCKFLCITCTPPPWAGLGFTWRGSLTRNDWERHALTINGHH
jgi:hypothetical protein